MHSHHSHSGSFCAHAVGTLEEVVLEAIRKGFTLYGLSEHVPRYREQDLYPEEAQFGISHLASTFEAYLKEAHRLKDRYADQIILLVGVESEFISSADLEELSAVLNRHQGQIDYVVGSVHHVHEIPIDFDKATWDRALRASSESMASFFRSYFDAQYEFMQQFKPEVVGHFDLCRLYIPSVKLDDPTHEDVWTRIQRNVDYAVEYGACFELNAASFRKGWDTAYPGYEVLQLIVSKGGKLVLSDDSHGPAAVGLNYHRLFEYLSSMNIEELWYLERCSVANPGGRYVRPVKCPDNWRSAEWWKGVMP